MAKAEPQRAITSFTVDGINVVRQGDIRSGDDPIVRARPELFQPMSDYIEQTTAAPGERRPVRMPSGVTAEEATTARDVRDGPRTKGKVADVPHSLPPEHEDSPASTFAPFQPAAGVQADDVVEKGQAPKGALKASDAQEQFAGKELDTSPGHTGEADLAVVETTDTDKSDGKPNKSSKG